MTRVTRQSTREVQGEASMQVSMTHRMSIKQLFIWLALVLVAIFSIALRWFPAIGYVDVTTSPVNWLKSVVLPVAVLSAPVIGMIAQQTRNAILEVLEKPFIRTLRAGGASSSSIPDRSTIQGNRMCTLAFARAGGAGASCNALS